MIKEQQICVKKILDKTVTVILNILGILVLLIVFYLLFYSYFEKQSFVRKCTSKGLNAEKCENIWFELKKID